MRLPSSPEPRWWLTAAKRCSDVRSLRRGARRRGPGEDQVRRSFSRAVPHAGGDPKLAREACQIHSHPLRCCDGQANCINVANETFKKETESHLHERRGDQLCAELCFTVRTM